MATPVQPPKDEDKDIRRAVSINAAPGAINQEFIELPTTLSRWIFRLVEATKAHRMAELDAEVAEEHLRLEVRAANDAAIEQTIKGDGKVKKATVDEIHALVVTNPAYRKGREKVIDAAALRDRARGMVDAIAAKKECLISLGAQVRSELEGDPSIRDRTGGGRR